MTALVEDLDHVAPSERRLERAIPRVYIDVDQNVFPVNKCDVDRHARGLATVVGGDAEIFTGPDTTLSVGLGKSAALSRTQKHRTSAAPRPTGCALASGDVGHTMRAVITAINADGSTPATSAQTGAVTGPAPGAPSNTALPTVSGMTIHGNALTTSNGSWSGSPTGCSYQWRQRNSSGNNCTSITGATGDCYTPESGDVGPGPQGREVAG